ncbi:DUF4242 domain-containing protein [Agriterribacter sp.]|uniref:DUF4242 domain-containing protein n=1 Tax=Agriterribacter sp. TaxID=2821509 RepID=UPI002CAE92DF|nr:DUF4242 domain-containing protein [Agriterribacter sp.]HRO46504.1 DUF4242 domain-containing protein [Agriterribacter sp.]HRQ17567.1 DUF4242 domain-containing protein [Agriterribacter sp.]
MKTTIKITALVFAILFMTSTAVKAQTENTKSESKTMKTYVIEREMPGAGMLTPEQLKGASQTSCTVLTEIGPKIQWMHSYVTGNKIYCVYKAENEKLILDHAKKAGFPANKVSEVVTMISPETAKQ